MDEYLHNEVGDAHDDDGHQNNQEAENENNDENNNGGEDENGHHQMMYNGHDGEPLRQGNFYLTNQIFKL